MTDIAMKNNGTALLNQRDIETNLETARRFLNRDYVLKLSTASGIAQKPSGINTQHIRMFRIGRIVYDGQDTAAKLLSVYNTMNGIADTCFMMIHGTKEAAALYLGVRADTNAASLAGSALENSIRGNFPGTEIRMLANGECADVLGKIRTDGGRRSRCNYRRDDRIRAYRRYRRRFCNRSGYRHSGRLFDLCAGSPGPDCQRHCVSGSKGGGRSRKMKMRSFRFA